MSNFVVANGEKIEYQLTRKSVKNINMRVKSDNTIAVSANRRVPLNVVEQFIISKLSWIKAAQSRNENKKQNVSANNSIYYLGQALNIVIENSNTNNVVIIGSNLVISCSDTAKSDIILNEWLNNRCNEVFLKLCEQVYEIFKPMAPQKPIIKIKSMKSRWGSCHTSKRIITLNSRLIHYPMSAIEYVVVHEFAHLLQPNHSASFYNIVARILPDYKQRRKMLKQSLPG